MMKFLWRFLMILLSSLTFGVSKAPSPETYKQAFEAAKNRTVSALLVMGDSTVDSGNNNYIATPLRSNFPPYGKDFVNHVASGRFSNGRLPPDFVALYLGLKKYVPAYLDPELGIDDLVTGVSFASAGCGYDPVTGATMNLKNIANQVDQLKEYKEKLVSWIGKEEMENHIKKAVLLVSCGTNDFTITYFIGVGSRRLTFTFPRYVTFILDQIKKLVQDVWAEGLRTIAVAGLPPIGCLPSMITLFSNDRFRQRDCLEEYNFAARDFNVKLQKLLNSMESQYKNTQILYVDIYTPLINSIQGKDKPSFRHVDVGCCGTGYIEFGIICNPASYICPNASEYVFFDGSHPTEKGYSNIVEANRDIINKILDR